MPVPTRAKIGGVAMLNIKGAWMLAENGDFDHCAKALIRHKSAHPDETVKMLWNEKTITVATGDDAGSLWEKYQIEFHKPNPAQEEANRRHAEKTQREADARHAETAPVIAASQYQFTAKMAPITGKMNKDEMSVRRMITYALEYIDSHPGMNASTEAGARALQKILSEKFPESENPDHSFVNVHFELAVAKQAAAIAKTGWATYKTAQETQLRQGRPGEGKF